MLGPEATSKKRLHTERNKQLNTMSILLQQMVEYLAAERLAGDQGIRQATGTKAGDPAKSTLSDSTVSFLHLLLESLNRQATSTSAGDRAEAGVQASFTA